LDEEENLSTPQRSQAGGPDDISARQYAAAHSVLGAMGATPSITTSTRNKWQSGNVGCDGATALEASMYSIHSRNILNAARMEYVQASDTASSAIRKDVH